MQDTVGRQHDPKRRRREASKQSRPARDYLVSRLDRYRVAPLRSELGYGAPVMGGSQQSAGDRNAGYFAVSDCSDHERSVRLREISDTLATDAPRDQRSGDRPEPLSRDRVHPAHEVRSRRYPVQRVRRASLEWHDVIEAVVGGKE